jgi:thioesterase domain-containing protein
MVSSRYLKKLHVADSGKSVFLFPGILGSLNGYVNVIAELRNSCSVYGLRYPAKVRSDTQNVLQALGAICARHVEAASAGGPVHLLGWSMGGLVAYECGSMLYSAGHPADTVIMVDSSPGMVAQSAPTSSQASSKGRDAGAQRDFMWMQFLDLKCGRVTRDMLLEDYDFLRMPDREKFRIVAEHEKKWSTSILKPLRGRAAFRFMKANYRALQTYVPSRYPGTFHAIGSEEYREVIAPNWRTAGTDLINFVNVQGDHLTAILHFAIAPILQIVSRAPPAGSLP